MNAAAVLAELRGRGVQVTLAGDKVRLKVLHGIITEEIREMVAAHKQELLVLLAADEDPGVAWRVEAMRPQVPPRGPIPFLVARHDFAAQPDCCLSCGDLLGEGQRYRCRSCERAAWLVVNQVREGMRE